MNGWDWAIILDGKIFRLFRAALARDQTWLQLSRFSWMYRPFAWVLFLKSDIRLLFAQTQHKLQPCGTFTGFFSWCKLYLLSLIIWSFLSCNSHLELLCMFFHPVFLTIYVGSSPVYKLTLFYVIKRSMSAFCYAFSYVSDVTISVSSSFCKWLKLFFFSSLRSLWRVCH